MTFIYGLLFVALLIGCAYLSLRFFSRLIDVDMVAAMSWGFKAKRFELVLTWCLFYLIAFVFVFALLQKPFMLLTMKLSHEGGLLGYAVNGEYGKLYDPRQKEYVGYQISPPPPAAARFNETFEVVALYRPFLSRHYQNVEAQGLWISIVFIFLSALGLVLTYVILYGLANAYVAKLHSGQELSHALILGRFKEITGFPFFPALAGVVLFILASTWIGASMVNRITRDYGELFSDARKNHTAEVLANAAPGRILRGRLINRIEDLQKVYGNRNRKEPDRTILKTSYTIEFTKVVRYTPVYLRITYLGEPGSDPAMQALDRFFPPRTSWSISEIIANDYAADAQGPAELDFRVNENLGVSPVTEKGEK